MLRCKSQSLTGTLVKESQVDATFAVDHGWRLSFASAVAAAAVRDPPTPGDFSLPEWISPK